MANRIHCKGPYAHEEAYAAEAGIYPGMLVKLDSNGKVALHTTEGGEIGDEVMIVEEDVLQGKTVSTVYTISTIVSLIIPQKGSEVRVLIAEDQVISIGEKIVSNGNGLLKSIEDMTSPSKSPHVLGVSKEDCDLASGAGNVLCAIRVV